MKPQGILELEKLLNTEFKKVKIEDIAKYKLERTAEYSQDQEGNIIGLCISKFKLEEIPQSISEFEKLTHLNFYDNSISDISPIAALANLTEIYFSSNSISDISPIAALANLTWIYFWDNSISDISPIASLTNLTRISFYNNSISDISPIASLANLTGISFYNNSISDIPLIVFRNLEKFDNWYSVLRGNKVQNPPLEIISQGRDAILNYFEKIEKEGKEYLFESKVLIIGEGGAGKTSFAVKIQDEHSELPEDEATTLGIEVSHWNFDIQHQGQAKKMYVNLWDFGGQKVYRGTHQLFFSQKSFYVLLDDSRAEKMEHSYWLNTLEQLAGEQSKVLILTNKKHGHSKSLDENGLKGRFGKIIHDFVALDLKNDTKIIVSLRKDLQHILPKMEGMGDPVPSSWVKIREELFQIKKNWISYDAYFEICEKYNSEISEKDIGFMSDYFNRIGVFTHYYKDKILKNRVFLNSNWLLHIVYEVLNHKLVKDNLGKITKVDLQEIWSEDKRSIKKEYLRPLMQRFGMMYEIKEEQRYIVPQHLSAEQPYTTWKHEKSGEILQFAYEFDKYMPAGIMPRLIVALRDCIKNHELVWQKGVNLSYEASHAEITETYDKTNKYLIRICGKEKKELLGIINREFGKILAPFQNLHYEKLVPCICGECKGVAKPYFFEYSSLEKRKEKGKRSIECDRSYEPVNVIKLLEGVSISEDKMKNIMNQSEKIKIFVSYSSEDRGLRKLLVKGISKHLANRKGFDYQIWDDTAIDLGADWKKTIKKALKESNVALLLVSASFASSQFINEHELTTFFKKQKKKGYLILPVLITDYEFSEFEKLSALNFFKTYNSEYGFNSPLERHELLPYNKLAEGTNTTDSMLNLYSKNLTDFIHTAVQNHFKK